MSQKRKYIVLIETDNAAEYDRVYDYMKYATCNYAMIDPDAYLIESYLSPSDLTDELIDRLSSLTRCFVAEITGEVTWRNAHCGFNTINSFLNC